MAAGSSSSWVDTARYVLGEAASDVRQALSGVAQSAERRVDAAVDAEAERLYQQFSARAAADASAFVRRYRPWFVVLLVLLALTVLFAAISMVASLYAARQCSKRCAQPPALALGPAAAAARLPFM